MLGLYRFCCKSPFSSSRAATNSSCSISRARSDDGPNRDCSLAIVETIILAVCLVQTPSICREVNISVEPDPAGSMQLPFHCARRGQMEGQKWIAGNSHLAH